MSSLGIGLGAFMGGFKDGYGLGNRIKDQKRENKLQAEADVQTDALKKINTDTAAKFDEGVKAGTYNPDQFEQFFKDHAVPLQKQQMLRDGDVEGAKRWTDWADTSDAKEGAKLFGSAIYKAQNGDDVGAWEDAGKAAAKAGYVKHPYKTLGVDTLVQNGKPIGTRIRLQGEDGKEFSHDVPLGMTGKAISDNLNPIAAASTFAAASAAEATRQKERGEKREDFVFQEKTKQQYAPEKKDVNAAAYSAAQENLLKNDLDFAGLTPEEQDKRVRAQLAAAEQYSTDKAPGLGRQINRPAPPQREIIDTQTGQPVQAPQQAAPAQPGLGQTQAPAPTPEANPNNINSSMAPGKQGEVRRGPDGRTYQYAETTGMAGDNGGQGWIPVVAPEQQAAQQGAPAQAKVAPQANAAPTRQELIADAADYMAQGGNPNAIAQLLVNAGITPQEWPKGLEQAVASTQGGAVPSLPRS